MELASTSSEVSGVRPDASSPFRFYLGTARAGWLASAPYPLMVSRRILAPRRTLPRARCSWALDSGGFSELSLYGRWTVSAAQYAREARRFAGEIGLLEWAASIDWMCEPTMLERTGLSLREHQRRTVAGYCELAERAPEIRWVPVLQGWLPEEYLRHVEDYRRAGVDLGKLPLVGIGSVCRRQRTGAVEALVRQLHGMGLRLHGFGIKLGGLLRAGDALVSADSMAWSLAARFELRALPGHEGLHRRCTGCPEYAHRWRDALLARLEGARGHGLVPRQMPLPLAPAACPR